jgi:hypothetical protein
MVVAQAEIVALNGKLGIQITKLVAGSDSIVQPTAIAST